MTKEELKEAKMALNRALNTPQRGGEPVQEPSGQVRRLTDWSEVLTSRNGGL